jgi:hypothetical protein
VALLLFSEKGVDFQGAGSGGRGFVCDTTDWRIGLEIDAGPSIVEGKGSSFDVAGPNDAGEKGFADAVVVSVAVRESVMDIALILFFRSDGG